MINWRDFANLAVFQTLNFMKESVLRIHTPDGSITTMTTSELAQLKNIIAATTGNVYYTHSGTGSATQPGTKDQPRSTIDLGYNLCSAGDILVVLPGHSEDIDADSGADLDTVGVAVVGLGYGTRRPTVNFNGTDAAKDIKMDAASNRLLNILFICSDVGNDQAMAIEMSGTDCELALCEFRDDGTSQPLNYVSVGLADGDCDRSYIHDNKFRVTGSGTANSAISVLFDMTALRLEHNDIYGDWDEAGIIFQTGGNAQLDLRVIRNDVTNNQAGLYAIDIHNATSGSTGLVAGNRVQCSARAASLASGGCAPIDNTWSDGVTSSPVEDIDEDKLSYVALNTAASATVLVLPSLGGLGDDFFNQEWYVQVIDAGDALPEGEIRLVTDYVSATGTFTCAAFSTALADGDKVAVIHKSLALANPLGIKIERTKADLFTGGSVNLFTITGTVEITQFSGLIEDGAHDATADNFKFVSTPTTGTGGDLCAVVAAANFEEGTVLSLTGTLGDALSGAAAGGFAVASMSIPIVVPAGVISSSSSGDGGAGNNATLSLVLHYRPLTKGASIILV